MLTCQWASVLTGLTSVMLLRTVIAPEFPQCKWKGDERTSRGGASATNRGCGRLVGLQILGRAVRLEAFLHGLPELGARAETVGVRTVSRCDADSQGPRGREQFTGGRTRGTGY